MKTLASLIIGIILSAPAFAQRDRVQVEPAFVSYQGMQGAPLRNPNGIFYHAKKQEIYVADSGSHQILIFDKKGAAIGRFPHMVDGASQDSRLEGEPRGIAVNGRGDIFVTDNLARYIDILDYRGRSIRKIYPADYLQISRETVSPVQLALDSQDNLYVAVSGEESCVLVVDKSLKLQRKIGKKGTEAGQFQAPGGVWVDRDGKVYVTDALGTPLQVFDKDGRYLLGFGDKGFGPMSFGLPSGCVTDKQGNIWVLDGTQCKVAVFDSKGSWLNNVCGTGQAPGDVSYPTYISGDGIDTIVISERVGRRIQGLKVRFKDDQPTK